MKGLLRREPPNGYVVHKLTLTGETPLLMSSGEVDRESELYREYEALSTARKKTSEQKAQLRELEWSVRIYFDEKIGPYIPGKNVKELLRESATKWRLGETVRRSLVVPDYRIPLLYEGPRTLKGLWDEGYRYTAMVSNAGAGSGRVERTRPCFDEWWLECEVAFDTDEINEDHFLRIVRRTEKYGLGDYRPEFGALTADTERIRVQQARVVANGAKKRDAKVERAVRKMADRITA